MIKKNKKIRKYNTTLLSRNGNYDRAFNKIKSKPTNILET
jgi:hypothetical protein